MENPLHPRPAGLVPFCTRKGLVFSGTEKQVLARCVTHFVHKRKSACDANDIAPTPVFPEKMSILCLF
jgi:hypothetical protein